MGVEISFSQNYYWMDSWIFANILQLATQEFCDRYNDYNMDPGCRLYDQMVMAARCGVANIAEGSARHSTSIETEMRLLDVARASFDELQGDIFNFLLRRNVDVWAIGNPARESLWQIRLDPPNYSNSYSICPKCGKPMLKRTQRKGEQQGREFWGCSDYPRCNGIRRI